MVMSRIYAKASRTIVWLGEPTRFSYRALDLCHSLSSLPSFKSLHDEEQSKTLSEEHESNMLLDILDRPW
jgi:hypothetical protein